jgi:hypothetical protein
MLQQQKKRGGWPKGRKRKPELSEMRPPKAPATGYVLYLNEKRKQYKDLPFPEVKYIKIQCLLTRGMCVMTHNETDFFPFI